MHSVYEALPETLRRRIDGLRAVHGYDTPHRVMLDYPVGENRVMQRVLIEGDRPV